MKIEYLSKSLENTSFLATKIAKTLKKGSVITLDGDLGAGKTTFTQFLAKCIGVNDRVTSPTFNIMKIYQGDYVLNHLDLYRLSNVGFDQDLEEYIYSDAISVIEWSENVPNLLDKSVLKIKVKVISENERLFVIESENAIYLPLEDLS